MFYTNEISAFGHGSAAASKLRGLTSHDQLLIQISHSFSGLLLLMPAFVADKGFHSFFARCIMLHLMMAIRRLQRGIEDLAWDLPRVSWRLHFGSFMDLFPVVFIERKV
uniref:DUF7865 domain-containing protein n=1 Tax=Kalanchoe fedtschenkoi TaxID=63787 RepID=A0A7N0T6V2_KALFE